MERQEHIPDGYIFRPTDAELLVYLALYVTGKPVLSTVPIAAIDLYNGVEPWKIFQQSREKVLYIFTPLIRRSSSDSRYIRTIKDGKGTWKAQDRGKPIYRRYDNDDHDDNQQLMRQLIGYKRSLRYEKSGSKHDGRFLMKEYYFPSNIRATLERPLNDIVICRIKRKQNNRDIIGFESESIEARDIGDIIGELTKSPTYSEVNSLLETSN